MITPQMFNKFELNQTVGQVLLKLVQSYHHTCTPLPILF